MWGGGQNLNETDEKRKDVRNRQRLGMGKRSWQIRFMGWYFRSGMSAYIEGDRPPMLYTIHEWVFDAGH